MTDPRKQAIIDALDKWIRQRPGLEFGNYGEWPAYRAEVRSIGKDLREARILLRQVELRDSITADDLLEASRSAYSGRLTLTVAPHPCAPDGCTTNMVAKIDYCTGQYWPTEYRRAVCAVLASALWARKRADMPEPFKVYGTNDNWYALKDSEKPARPVSAGDWIRQSFRREFGRGMASRWFS